MRRVHGHRWRLQRLPGNAPCFLYGVVGRLLHLLRLLRLLRRLRRLRRLHEGLACVAVAANLVVRALRRTTILLLVLASEPAHRLGLGLGLVRAS